MRHRHLAQPMRVLLGLLNAAAEVIELAEVHGGQRVASVESVLQEPERLRIIDRGAESEVQTTPNFVGRVKAATTGGDPQRGQPRRSIFLSPLAGAFHQRFATGVFGRGVDRSIVVVGHRTVCERVIAVYRAGGQKHLFD